MSFCALLIKFVFSAWKSNIPFIQPRSTIYPQDVVANFKAARRSSQHVSTLEVGISWTRRSERGSSSAEQ